jgi:hypothetical protein
MIACRTYHSRERCSLRLWAADGRRKEREALGRRSRLKFQSSIFFYGRRDAHLHKQKLNGLQYFPDTPRKVGAMTGLSLEHNFTQNFLPHHPHLLPGPSSSHPSFAQTTRRLDFWVSTNVLFCNHPRSVLATLHGHAVLPRPTASRSSSALRRAPKPFKMASSASCPLPPLHLFTPPPRSLSHMALHPLRLTT